MSTIKPPFLTLLLAATYLLAWQPALAGAPVLETDTELATAGYFRLSWVAESPEDSILEESADSTFAEPAIVYSGPDTAALISGRPGGTYYYRVGYSPAQGEGAWSDVIRVEVAHHSLSRAFTFFALGALVFTVTLLTVVLGSRSHRD